jgi:alanyl-tRNA synthetase
MDRPAYETDAYLKSLDTEVVEVGQDAGRPWAVTVDTVLYPEGGGQPADRGTLGGVDVLDVQRVDGMIRHVLASPVAPGPVRLELDWPRRFDHMQQHTAQHLLTTIAQRRFGWTTMAFHLGPDVSDIEFDIPTLDEEQLEALEDAAVDEIRAARTVAVRWTERDRMEQLGVRSRLLPEGFEGPVRLIEIEGLDLNTCGGTHVANTAEIGTVTVIGTEPMRGGTRVFWVAGDRVRRRLAAHEARSLRLRSLLDTGDDELPDVVALRLEREKALAADRRRLVSELASAVAERFRAEPGRVVVEHWHDHDMAFLQEVGKALVRQAPDKVALLAAGPSNEGVFLLVASEPTGLDLAHAGAKVATVLGGRGGGHAPFYQGKASNLGRLDEAVGVLEKALRENSEFGIRNSETDPDAHS